jgi:iron complex outermembrane receptor protein
VFRTPYIGTAKQFTQDLRLTSSSPGRFNYIIGAFYQHEDVFNSTELRLWNGIDVNLDRTIDAQDCIDSGGALACRYYNQFDQIRNSWSVYADTTFRLTDPLKLRVGLRYNHDNGALRNFIAQLRGVDETPLANLIPGDPVNVDATLDNSFANRKTTGKIGLEYTPTDTTLLYVSASRGYRSSAFSAQAFFSPIEATATAPETLDAVELGFKTQWMDGKVRANGAVFHYIYKNQQVIDVNPVTLAQPLVNLGKSKVKGAELELVARPVHALTVNLGLGLLDAKLKDAVLRGTDLRGNRLPDSPEFSGTLAADWELFTGDRTRFGLHVDADYTSSQYFEPFNIPRLRQDAYTLLNARLAFGSAQGKWELGLWGRNITDKFYVTSAADVSGIGFDYFHRGAPRTYGIDLNVSF